MKVIILAGGSGTRLWPLSRGRFPKQFLKFDSDKSLFQETIQRLSNSLAFKDCIIVTNEDYKFLIFDQLKNLGFNPSEAHIIYEPTSRNTAPAIALSVKFCLEKLNCSQDEVIFVTPSDHIIKPISKFAEYLRESEKVAKEDYIVTFGIVPNAPKTGYGYIKILESIQNQEGLTYFKVERFVEKPDFETAKKYLEDGRYYWNSGMFAFKIGVIIEEFKKHSSEIGSFLDLSYEEMLMNFSNLPNISIDYAIMENSERIAMLPLDIYWNDIGSWDAVYEIMERDDAGNVLKGDVLALDVKNSFILANKRLASLIGVEDIILVETDDALFIGKKDRCQEIKDIVEILRKKGRREEKEHLTDFRPWGNYTVLEEGFRYKIKRIVVNPGERLSLQRHFHRSEHWIVVKGTAKVTLGDKEVFLSENESIYVPKTVLHRLENPGKVPLELIEVQIGEYIGEDDIERFEDVYGRCF